MLWNIQFFCALRCAAFDVSLGWHSHIQATGEVLMERHVGVYCGGCSLEGSSAFFLFGAILLPTHYHAQTRLPAKTCAGAERYWVSVRRLFLCTRLRTFLHSAVIYGAVSILQRLDNISFILDGTSSAFGIASVWPYRALLGFNCSRVTIAAQCSPSYVSTWRGGCLTDLEGPFISWYVFFLFLGGQTSPPTRYCSFILERQRGNSSVVLVPRGRAPSLRPIANADIAPRKVVRG